MLRLTKVRARLLYVFIFFKCNDILSVLTVKVGGNGTFGFLERTRLCTCGAAVYAGKRLRHPAHRLCAHLLVSSLPLSYWLYLLVTTTVHLRELSICVRWEQLLGRVDLSFTDPNNGDPLPLVA
jgi:hypothetical protein